MKICNMQGAFIVYLNFLLVQTADFLVKEFRDLRALGKTSA